MKSDRREEILDIAQRLTQAKGLNGFSYIDISDKIGIKTSSIHYYFKTKDDLAVALIKRYHENFKLQLDFIDANSTTPEEKLIKFADIFKGLAATRETFCLCGMMAAELAALSDESHKELMRYFQACRQWLEKVFLLLGSKEPEVDAVGYLSLLEGVLLIARVEGRPEMIDEVARSFTGKFIV